MLSQEEVSWLYDHFRDLSQAEVGLILDVSQQRVSKFLEVRRRRKEALINRTDKHPTDCRDGGLKVSSLYYR